MAAPPCPRANPALGSALDLRRSQIRTYERVMREHGDVVRLVVGPPGLRFDLYCVFHPDGVKAVLAGSRASYSKGTRFYQQIAEAFGRGLLTSEGELWQRQRRLVQPLFTRKQIATYSELMAEEAAAVAERWDRATRDGARVDANAEMVGLALRVVARAIFGDDVVRARDVLDSSFQVLNRHAFRRAMSPLAPPASWPTPDNRRAARARRGLYGVVDELIAHRQPAGADPTRFTPERERARHPHAYFPFGGGARACIGSHFAMLEAVIAMGVVLQRFRISSDQDTVPLDTAGITLRPKGAVPIRLAAR
jgi:cytochrome P450